MTTMAGLKARREYLVIAENVLGQEIRIKRFKLRSLAKHYGDTQYGEKWDWRWEIKTVAPKPSPPKPIYSFSPAAHSVWDYAHPSCRAV